ncbi:hypothetical protein EF910_08145 [Streptomyces sp. WAC07149]|uniref:hypothetical protein n=1 Tax=Streptomyces sp. WAC07149 TaxID=2487425 RepID=UPI000F7B65A9|nr:hypothetical protein [Streptomyces sp. WAC07149]RST06943.1 hypothetical protein EF910_08145 [Streptomyces sp. WAC07149]
MSRKPEKANGGEQGNPSAHRSFHPERYAPERGPGRTVSKEEESGGAHGRPTPRSTRGGEETAASGERGMRDHGRRGRSGRPSGGKDASAFTGIRPEDHETEGPSGR